MNERDETPVTIQLDAPRQYRDRETYQVQTIGPGPATVPRWIAEKWGYAVAELPLAEPWLGYGELKVDEIKQRLRGLSKEEREAVRQFEEDHGPRRGIINVLDALIEEEAAATQGQNAQG